MASRQRAEHVVSGILSDVTAACSGRDPPVSPALIGSVVKAVVLHPDNAFGPEKELSDDDLTAITRRCVDRLSDDSDVGVACLALQADMATARRTYEDIRLARQRELASTMEQVDEEILDTRARSRADLENLYRKIVSSILLRSGLGAATDVRVVKETTAALESVLPPEELGTFMTLARSDKRQQLRDLCSIVVGIRLFNRAAGKGGRSITDLPAVLVEAAVSLSDVMRNNFQMLSRSALQLTAKLFEAEPGAEVDAARAWSYYLRQILVYFQLLQGDLAQSAERLAQAVVAIEERQAKLKSTVEAKVAVPTDQVYPQFVHLAEIWQTLQQEHAYVSSLTEAINRAIESANQARALPDEIESNLSGLSASKELKECASLELAEFDRLCTVTQALAQRRNFEHSPPEPAFEERPASLSDFAEKDEHIYLLASEATHGIANLPLQCAAFCPVAMALNGAIAPVKRYLGILRRGNHFFGFSSLKNLLEFAAAPETIMVTVSDAARRNAELVELMDLHALVAGVRGFEQAQRGVDASLAIKSDSGMQTELHPVEANIDKQYEWNEWELRRKALKLANLRSKKTHSTQTHESNYRRANETQVYLPKTKDTQTRRDAYSNTSKPVTYIRGLRGPRGPREVIPEVVDLTLGVTGHTVTASTGTGSPRQAPGMSAGSASSRRLASGSKR